MNSKKKTVVLVIALFVAALHLLPIEKLLDARWLVLYHSYFSDLVLPFVFYFLLFLVEQNVPALKGWRMKALAVFLAPTGAEILQYFHIYALGITFDPLDMVMYAVGAGLAVLVDRLVFLRVFGFWQEA